jgi:hypothetical protein
MTVIMRISHGSRPAHHARASHSCPAVISDTMAPVRSMLDGRLYDSKAALRATYKKAGVIEVGNDPAIHRKAGRRPDRRAIRDSVDRAFARAGLD